ncbi:hypothetical protein CDAR_95561 [Caerostris darwini]|uniref:Secreted protein n=1 Tax=Caerostris darwini TaxID=1538125 RepID=A0AAV4M6N5_9ARAC|nr:hypothetical protein CDAR_95561 [Caerostris darwini]
MGSVTRVIARFQCSGACCLISPLSLHGCDSGRCRPNRPAVMKRKVLVTATIRAMSFEGSIPVAADIGSSENRPRISAPSRKNDSAQDSNWVHSFRLFH